MHLQLGVKCLLLECTPKLSESASSWSIFPSSATNKAHGSSQEFDPTTEIESRHDLDLEKTRHLDLVRHSQVKLELRPGGSPGQARPGKESLTQFPLLHDPAMMRCRPYSH
ncbi:hypothetical protein Pfo_007009 [Paulownia fortunei]|nr:hypothetical protein Pfo_007009 [Paulownia fortunei]